MSVSSMCTVKSLSRRIKVNVIRMIHLCHIVSKPPSFPIARELPVARSYKEHPTMARAVGGDVLSRDPRIFSSLAMIGGKPSIVHTVGNTLKLIAMSF